MTSTRPEWQMPPTEVLLQALESNMRGIVMMRGVGGWRGEGSVRIQK